MIDRALTTTMLPHITWAFVAAEYNDPPSFVEVFGSPDLPEALLARTESGNWYVYEDVRYHTLNPDHLAAFVRRWNIDHGHMEATDD